VEKRSCTTALAAISPIWSNLAHGKKKRLRMQPEVSHERAQPLGIDVRVTRGGCDTLMAHEPLDIAQVGSALVEQEGGDRMTQRMSGNNRHPRTLTGELEACVEGLVAKGRAVPAGKTSADPAKSTPLVRSRTPFTLSRKANHSSSESDNSGVRGRSPNEPPLTWRRAAIITPPRSRTSLSTVKSAHSWYRQPVKKRAVAK
jgi:hypothetical protein